MEDLEISEVSEKEFSDKKKFYDFCDQTFGISSEEKDKILTKFCDKQIKLTLKNNDERKSGHGANLDNFRRFLEKDKIFSKELHAVREELGLGEVKYSQRTYKNIDEASDDLLYQLWLAHGAKGDFEEDILGKIEKIKTGALSERDAKPIYHYTGVINRGVDHILDVFCLNGGWREYVLAKIASPDKNQSNISFRRLLEEDFPIKVESVRGDSITLTIKPGFRASYGRVIYDALKPILIQLTIAETRDDEILVQRPLYVDKNFPDHTSVADIVKWLYPESDIDMEVDRVKKLYKKD